MGAYENKPDWFVTDGPYKLLGALGTYDMGSVDKILGRNDLLPIGANMVFRRNLFAELGLFAENLGRKEGSKYVLSFEDTEFYERVVSKSHAVAYLANAIVDHHIDTGRFDKKKLKKWFYGSGIILARMNQEVPNIVIFGVPGYIIKEAVKLFFRICFYGTTLNKEASFYYLTRLWIYFGMMKYYRNPSILEG